VLWSALAGTTVEIDGESVEVGLPTRRISVRAAGELREMRIGGEVVELREERLPGVVKELLEVSPGCVHALKMKLEYSEDKDERRRIREELERVDPMRERYYRELERRAFKTYLIEPLVGSI